MAVWHHVRTSVLLHPHNIRCAHELTLDTKENKQSARDPFKRLADFKDDDNCAALEHWITSKLQRFKIEALLHIATHSNNCRFYFQRHQIIGNNCSDFERESIFTSLLFA